MNIARMDYLEDTDLTVTADPRMASQPQRFQEAQSIMNIINSTPAAAQMPLVQVAGLRLIFKAIDNTDMTAALNQQLSQPPPMAPPPSGPPPKKGPPGQAPGGGPPQPDNAVPNSGNQPPNGEAPEGQVT
jgi:hypothetical protein